MTIAVELANGVYPAVTGTISHEAIYQAIHAQGRLGLPKGLHVELHRGRRCRRHRPRKGTIVPVKAGPPGEFNLIGVRLVEAAGRQQVGHLEGDLICGSYSRSAIATVFDRTSRHLWLADFPEDHGADATLAAMVELLERIPTELRLTLTWDQGREMARHRDLATFTGIDVYFAEPHSPWQRPTNENSNGLIRRYVGKGTNLRRLHHQRPPCHRNPHQHHPCRSLHWSTARQVHNAAVAITG